AAAADVAAHRFFDVLVGRPGVVLEQRARAHDLAALAVATLYDVVGHPGLLNGAADWILVHRLDGDDGAVADQGHGNDAGASGDPTDVHRARSTGGDAAAVLGPGHLQVVPKDPQQ